MSLCRKCEPGLSCYDVMFKLESENIQHEVFLGLRNFSVMSLGRECELL